MGYVSDNAYQDVSYVLADGIYPRWRIFVKTIPTEAQDIVAKKHFSSQQEAVSKDIERDFGVLEARFSWTRHQFASVTRTSGMPSNFASFFTSGTDCPTIGLRGLLRNFSTKSWNSVQWNTYCCAAA
jgi:Plant transposon protein